MLGEDKTSSASFVLAAKRFTYFKGARPPALNESRGERGHGRPGWMEGRKMAQIVSPFVSGLFHPLCLSASLSAS